MPFFLAELFLKPPLNAGGYHTYQYTWQPRIFLEDGASLANAADSSNPASSAVFRYQPDNQFAFFVDRLIEVNLYSIPTLMAKFTSYCEYEKVEGGAALKL